METTHDKFIGSQIEKKTVTITSEAPNQTSYFNKIKIGGKKFYVINVIIMKFAVMFSCFVLH